MHDRLRALVLAGSALLLPQVAGAAPLLLRQPAISRTRIVFNYAGDLWIAPRDGGNASRLTVGVGAETNPCFSPDGTLVAFSGEYDGNLDVYVVPATGGTPRRLTFHPGDETVLGFTPDGKSVLYATTADSFYHFAAQIDEVPVGGGVPTRLPLVIGFEASLSPDASHVAYVPHGQWQPAWKRYRGGQTTPIWIADLEDSSVVKVPRDNSNDHNPLWVGDVVYFLSDRGGPVSLYAYDTRTRQVTEALRSDGFDFKSASAAADAIVVEEFGGLKLYDLATHAAKRIEISVAGELPAARPHFASVKPERIRNFGISPQASARSSRPGARS